jgi:hypothetical protein
LAGFFATKFLSAGFLAAVFAVLAGVFDLSLSDVSAFASSFSGAGAVTSFVCEAYLAA